MKISQCLGVDVRTVQDIRKELDASNGENEGTVSRKPNTDLSDKKRLVRFVGEILAMIDNNPKKSGHGIISVSYQARSAWRNLVFLTLDEKCLIFITNLEMPNFYNQPWNASFL